MLTLAESARRDAMEAVDVAALDKFRAELKARVIRIILAEFNATPFAHIGDLDLKPLRDNLEDGLSDALWDIQQEIA